MQIDGRSGSPLAKALLVAGLMTTTSMVAPADATVLPDPTDISADSAAALGERATMSTAAVKALRHITQARDDIRDGESASFGRELDKADTLLHFVEATLPTGIAKDRIQAARNHLESADMRGVRSDLAPAYKSLIQLARYMPVEDVGRHLDQATESLSASNGARASYELDAANAALNSSETELPLRAARRLLARAKSEMQAHDTQAAEAALNAAEDNVVFLTVAMHEPLAEAHLALWRAMRHYAAGSRDSTADEIGRAVRYLEYSAGGTDRKARRIVAALLDQVRSLEPVAGADAGNTALRLGDLWARTKALSARSAEYFTTESEAPAADRNFKASLIEAKLHLAFAEADGLLRSDSKASQIELDRAARYLENALTQAQSHPAAEIEAIRNDIGDLNRRYVRDQLKDRYANLRQRLSGQIGML